MGHSSRKRGERGEVHMIHVRVGQQDQIDRGQLAESQRRSDITFRAGGSEAQGDANASSESGVSEDVETEKVDQDGRMTEPTKRHGIVRPF